jgi:hypothetical protein
LCTVHHNEVPDTVIWATLHVNWLYHPANKVYPGISHDLGT